MTINPIGMDIKTWADAVVQELRRHRTTAPVLESGQPWQEWGLRVANLPALLGFNIPNPNNFDDFYEWACRFNGAIQL
jgi:hypothetical protein